ncbi:hypothetical protein [Shouchella clausii]|uniref:Uncharacterized protein n=1 Tax=Shouchella clausii TaxID=79880 RepID=A0A268NVU8_SHOCL|nr:hypothetical protein [Shouchella clausii]PAE87643.1 hypothetical protein CHH72_17305 [Shouchella clausii]
MEAVMELREMQTELKATKREIGALKALYKFASTDKLIFEYLADGSGRYNAVGFLAHYAGMSDSEILSQEEHEIAKREDIISAVSPYVYRLSLQWLEDFLSRDKIREYLSRTIRDVECGFFNARRLTYEFENKLIEQGKIPSRTIAVTIVPTIRGAFLEMIFDGEKAFSLATGLDIAKTNIKGDIMDDTDIDKLQKEVDKLVDEVKHQIGNKLFLYDDVYKRIVTGPDTEKLFNIIVDHLKG